MSEYIDLHDVDRQLTGETVREATHRETYEELGLDLDFSNHRPVASINFAGGFDDFFTIEIDGEGIEFALQEEEIDEVMERIKTQGTYPRNRMKKWRKGDLVYDCRSFGGAETKTG